jgi:hypothetical protein
MNPKSQSLFHFTKDLNTLKEILNNGFWPQYCLENQIWLKQEGKELSYAFPIVCFCDIPLARINEHIKFYGKFGIGLSKNWALSNGLNPVSYFAKSSIFGKGVKSLLNEHNKLLDHKEGTELRKIFDKTVSDVNMFFAHIKPIRGKVPNKKGIKEFYQESEWRYTAKRTKDANIWSWLHKWQVEDLKFMKKAEQDTKKYSLLKMSPKDIKYIFVETENDIPEIIEFIQSKLVKYEKTERDILMSRVISIERINEDI